MAELERLAVEVEADAGSAIREIRAVDRAADEAAEDRTAEINFKTDRRGIDQARDSLGRFTAAADRAGGGGGGGSIGRLSMSMGKANNAARFFGNSMKLIKWPLMISGAQAATAGLIALGGATVGLTSALRPLAGAMAALPQGFSLLASVLGTAKLGFFGIGAATKAYAAQTKGVGAAATKTASATKKLASTGRELEQATRAVTDAQKDVIKAQQGVTEATQDLSKAQAALNQLLTGQQYMADLAEQERDVERASMTLTRAQEGLADAQRRLNEAMNPAPASALDIRDAELDLADAQRLLNSLRAEGAIDINAMQRAERELGVELDDQADLFRTSTATAEELARAEIDVARAAEALAKLQGQGTADAEEVAEAQRDVRDASYSVKTAEQEQADALADLNKMQREGIEGSKAVIDAREDVADAAKGVIAANERLSESHQGVRDAQRDLLDTQRQLREAQADLADSFDSAGGGASGLTDALNDLSPAGRRFAEFIQRELVPRLKELRTIAQENLLPGLQQGITNALPLFDHLKVAVGDMAKEMGTVATNLGTLMGSDFFTGAFSRVARSNADIVRDSLGPAFINFASGLMSLMDAARPLTEYLGTLVLRFSEVFKVWAEGKQSMENPFGETITTIEKLVKILGNLWSGLGNVMDAAKPLGTWILDGIVKVTAKFKEWTSQTDNMQKMRDFFEALKEPLAAGAKLLGDIVLAMFRVGAGTPEDGFKGFDSLTKTLTTINEQVPKVEKFFEGIRDSQFLNTFIKAMADWLPVINMLFGPTGGLTTAIGIFGDIGAAVSKVMAVTGTAGLMGNMSHIAGTVGVAVIAFSIMKAGVLKLLNPFKKLGQAVGIFKKPGALLNCTDAVKCTDTTTGKVGVLKGAFAKLGEGAKTLGGKMKTAFSGIVGAASGMGSKVGPAVSKIGPIISKALMSVGSMIGSVAGLMIPWGLIIAAALLLGVVLWKNKDKILDFFKKLPDLILDFFGKAGEWLADMGKKILEGLLTGIVWLWEHSIYKWFWDRKDAVLDFFKDAVKWLFDVGKLVLEGLWKGIQWIWDNVIKRYFDIAKWIGDKFIGVGTWLFEKGKDVLRGLWEGIQWIWNNVIVGAFNVAKWIGDKLIGAATWLFEKGKDILRGLWDGILNIKSWLLERVTGIIGWVTGAIGDGGKVLYEKGKDIITGLWNGLQASKDWIIEKVSGLLKAIIPGPLEKIFNMGSPSKLMASYGMDIGKGLYLGMESTAGLVSKAAEHMARAATPVMDHSGTVNGLAAFGGAGGAGKIMPGAGNIVLQITVNGGSTTKETVGAVSDAGQQLIRQLVRELRSS